jgi:hypothetical protein
MLCGYDDLGFPNNLDRALLKRARQWERDLADFSAYKLLYLKSNLGASRKLNICSDSAPTSPASLDLTTVWCLTTTSGAAYRSESDRSQRFLMHSSSELSSYIHYKTF